MRASVLVAPLATILLSMTTGAAQQKTELSAPVDTILAGRAVSLSNHQGMCKLARADTSAIVLDMRWPCQFSVNRRQDVRVETYLKTPILMVERSEHLPPPSRDCRTDVQAVRWYKGKLEAAEAQHIAMCGPSHWDQKMFMGVFDW